MRVPVRIPIGGKPVKIEYVEQILDDDGATPIYGESIDGDLSIRISTSRPRDEGMVWQVIIHELCHVVFDFTGITNQLDTHKGLEESICTSLDNLLGPWLRLRQDIPGAKYKEVEFDFEEDK